MIYSEVYVVEPLVESFTLLSFHWHPYIQFLIQMIQNISNFDNFAVKIVYPKCLNDTELIYFLDFGRIFR